MEIAVCARRAAWFAEVCCAEGKPVHLGQTLVIMAEADAMSLSLDIANLARALRRRRDHAGSDRREVYARIRAKGALPDWITLVEEGTAVAKARAAAAWAALRHSLRRQGQYRRRRTADDLRLPGLRLCGGTVGDGRRAAWSRPARSSIGKTNLDQFATGLNGTRSPYGIPASTFDPDYISGGSSSGSAVAVAAGLVSFALGTDTAGSGRVPAAFNNIVGLKPTKGIISMRGVVPACRTSGHRLGLRADGRRRRQSRERPSSPSTRRTPTREATRHRSRSIAPPRPLRVGVPNAADLVLR